MWFIIFLNSSRFSTGEVINFMSTDTDRVVNFAPSIHAAWSLPFQFIVTLILLYKQVYHTHVSSDIWVQIHFKVGMAFLSGLIFTILIIPVNKVIASRIGLLSEKMMQAKDKRVNTMSELLSGIRVIKYFNWQDVFADKVNTQRKEVYYSIDL